MGVDRLAYLRIDSPTLLPRLRYYDEATRYLIPSIWCGVLFVMAFWSVPSHKAFARLKEVLTTVDPEGHLELIVVDTDGSEVLQEVPEFHGKLHGWGETAWVLHGKILHTSGLGYHPECFEPLTRQLLAASAASPGA
jgi:hypothetical protein